jgi:hypothetical protein
MTGNPEGEYQGLFSGRFMATGRGRQAGCRAAMGDAAEGGHRGFFKPALELSERDPPPDIITRPAFRADKDDAVHFPRGFDRVVPACIATDERGMEPQTVPAGRAYVKFIPDLVLGYFSGFRHNTHVL